MKAVEVGAISEILNKSNNAKKKQEQTKKPVAQIKKESVDEEINEESNEEINEESAQNQSKFDTALSIGDDLKTLSTPKVETIDEVIDKKMRTIFVANVALKVAKRNLKAIFKKYGEIEAILFRNLPFDDTKKPYQTKVNSKMFSKEKDSKSAFVIFKDKNSAEKACNESGTLLKGQHINVTLSYRKTVRTKNGVFVANLPPIIQDEDLRNLIEDKCGKIKSLRIVRGEDKIKATGYAFINFKDNDGYQTAIGLSNKIKFKENILRIQPLRKDYAKRQLEKKEQQEQKEELRIKRPRRDNQDFTQRKNVNVNYKNRNPQQSTNKTKTQ